MSKNAKIVESFIRAWSNLDPEELVNYFTEDGTYYNMPSQPVTGRENLLAFISGFIANWDKTEWDIINLFEHDNLVIAERLDRTVSGSKSVDLPCMGIFEMADGKIKIWRDYFDIGTYIKAMG